VKSWIWDQIEAHIRTKTRIPFYAGLTNQIGGIDHNLLLAVRGGQDFLYLDNSYFGRGSRSRNFRLIRGGLHLTQQLERPADRRAKWNPTTCDYVRGGRHVLVIPPSPYFVHFYDAGSWLQDTTKQLSLNTDRPVIVKHDKKATTCRLSIRRVGGRYVCERGGCGSCHIGDSGVCGRTLPSVPGDGGDTC
jgi:hypothetical protein